MICHLLGVVYSDSCAYAMLGVAMISGVAEHYGRRYADAQALNGLREKLRHFDRKRLNDYDREFMQSIKNKLSLFGDDSTFTQAQLNHIDLMSIRYKGSKHYEPS